MQTPNLHLPMVAAAQAQKHVTVNEALARLDAFVQLAVASRTIAAPPTSPDEGLAHVVPAGAVGEWSGQEGRLALRFGGRWDFEAPRAGWRAWVVDEARTVAFDGMAWIEPPPPSSVARIGVGATPDADNRLSVASPATLLSHAGGDHRLKVNKAAAAGTASLVFQTGFSGRAEIGLAGNEALSFKVSSDGATWRTALFVDAATGVVQTPLTARPGMRQLLVATKSDTFTTTSTTPVTVPGLALTLTPTQAPCRVRVGGHLTIGADYWYTVPRVALYRNGVKVWPAAGFLEHQLLADTPGNSAYVGMTVPLGFVDDLAETTPVTYEIRLASRSSGSSVHVNRRHLDSSLRGDCLLMVEELSS